MSSANLSMAAHELSKLQETLKIAKAKVLLKAAQVQVNQIYNNLAPSDSTMSNHHRSAVRQPSRSHQARGSHLSLARHKGDGQYVMGSWGNYPINLG
jgi:hypothetical protein